MDGSDLHVAGLIATAAFNCISLRNEIALSQIGHHRAVASVGF
jgi:hypothetical protein